MAYRYPPPAWEFSNLKVDQKIPDPIDDQASTHSCCCTLRGPSKVAVQHGLTLILFSMMIV